MWAVPLAMTTHPQGSPSANVPMQSAAGDMLQILETQHKFIPSLYFSLSILVPCFILLYFSFFLLH
jgi:hypothetical protein